MHEIGVPAVRPGRDAVEKRVRVDDIERVPAHMGYLERGILGLDRAHLALDPSEPRGLDELESPLAQKLHADTDAEKRPSLLPDGLLQRRDQARHALKPVLAVAVRTDARQHDAICR